MGDTQSVSISIPEGLADIKLEQYKKFIMMANEENGDEQALYHFCGLTPAQQQGMRKQDLNEIQNAIGLALNEKPPLTSTFKYRGVEYGFHPKLEDISLGEYIDLEEYLKEPYKHAEKILGVLYRPITRKVYGKYDIENYNPDKHTGLGFQELGADVFVGCLLFFYRLELKLLTAFLPSLVKPAMSQPLTDKPSSQENGVGIQPYIKLLEAISLKLMQ